MDYSALLSTPAVLAACITLVFSISIAYKTKGRVSGYIILLTLAAGWNAGVASLFFVNDPQSALAICRSIHACVALLISVLYVVLSQDPRPLRRDSWAILSAGIVLAFACITPELGIIENVRPVLYFERTIHFYGIPGSLYFVFLVYLTIVFFSLVSRLITLPPPLSFREKIQRKYLYVLSGLTAVGGINDLLPYMGVQTYFITDFPIYPFGSIGATAWVLGIIYADRRYRILQLYQLTESSKARTLALYGALYISALALIFEILINTPPATSPAFVFGITSLAMFLAAVLRKENLREYAGSPLGGLASHLN